jgi:hypothetical protein
MGIPQIIFIILVGMSLLINLFNHDEPKNQRYNFFEAVFSNGIMVGLLIWGGFFG